MGRRYMGRPRVRMVITTITRTPAHHMATTDRIGSITESSSAQVRGITGDITATVAIIRVVMPMDMVVAMSDVDT